MRLVRLIPLLLVMLFAMACSRLSQTVPQELVGNWVTDDENYQNKSLAIDQEYIVLYLGDDLVPKAERIDHLTSTKVQGVTNYVFETRDKAGHHDSIKLSYQAVHGGELRLSNPSQVVWKRTPAR